ncbi:DUF5683 domain-containing protein [Chitinophaga vietnamensis]|uniref:DUF5683 domain-containing protein n=1 Tax=Chitinophaga vietnamensis TaxID=2593957 RepID=UPI001177846E|nr:DUF5683 domain-containing protein [Chitinophaga vietnamensis]
MAKLAGNIINLVRSALLILAIFLAAPAGAAPTPQGMADTTVAAAPRVADTVKPLQHIATDTAKNIAPRRDSIVFRPDMPLPHSPRKAALYSAILPGLGQAYNREYWKIPLIYAAMGTCTGFFIFNMDQYKQYRDAYRIRMAGNPDVKDKFIVQYPNAQSLKVLRDTYREWVDYSVLFFVLSYGLNIIDATVFAHLRTFDISNDLTLQVTPTIINNRTPGIGVNISLGGKKASRKAFYYAGR